MASASKQIDEGQEVIPPDYRIETYTMRAEGNEKPREERLLVKKKADLGGDRVTRIARLLRKRRLDGSAEVRQRRREKIWRHHRGE